jgi:hypothetical protein
MGSLDSPDERMVEMSLTLANTVSGGGGIRSSHVRT